MVICIQFCGGCNPAIDRGELAAALQASLADQGHELIFNRPQEAELIIYLSGCDADCARRYNEADRPSVRVAGARIGGLTVPASGLAAALVDEVRRYLVEGGKADEP